MHPGAGRYSGKRCVGLNAKPRVDARGWWQSQYHFRQWPGEVWAINGAAGWCHRNGIDAAFLTVHPTTQPVPDCIRRVVLGTECAPEMFDALVGRDVRVLPDVEINGEMHRGGTTATATAFALPYMGFSDVTFFGLEGSYGETQSHSYPTAKDPNEVWIVVMAGPRLYRTKLEFLHQSVVLAELVNAFPQYEERSGGLLRALVADHEYDVTDMMPTLREEIERATAH